VVFQLSPKLRALDDSYLRKAIQRVLKTALDYTPLFWSTTEYKNSSEKKLKHLNYEIFLYPGEMKKVEPTLEKLSGLYEIDPTTNKPKINADGTKKKRIGLSYAVDFPASIDSRKEQAWLYGEFYSIYNWPGYCTKQFKSRVRARDPSKRLLVAPYREIREKR